MAELLVTNAVKSDPEIRARLKKEFKRLGVSVEEVAEKSGIAKGTLDNIMSGRTDSMKDVHIQAIWQAYPAMRFEYILTDRIEETPTVIVTKVGKVNVELS